MDNADLIRNYSQLLSLAVHEFRTPLSVVGGYLRMLQRDVDAPLSDRQRKMVEDAERSCARIVALVSELNEVSKLDDPQHKLHTESFDLFTTVRDVAGETHEGEDRAVRLEVRGADSGAVMSGDHARLHGAVAAIVRAVLREQPAEAIVVVDCQLVDDGPGRGALLVIAPEAAAADATTSAPGALDEKKGGLGLAVPIARRVIERHGGRVWAPQAPGQPVSGAKGGVVIALPLPA